MLQKVIMERDEIEMSKEELQTWIREKVKKNKLISSDVLETYKLLQSVLEKREKQATQILKLCESVSACEAIVERQYCLLGLKYTDDDDDDDDDNIPGCGSPVSINSPTPQLSKQQDSENLCRAYYKDLCLKRKPVVVLHRLSKSEIRFFQSSTPEDRYSDNYSFSGSDVQWEPEYNSSDSDCSISSSNAGSNKRRRIDDKHKTLAKSQATPQANINSSEVTITSTPQASAKNTDAKSNIQRTLSPKGGANTDDQDTTTKISTPQASTNANAKSNILKTSSPKGGANTDAPSNAKKMSTPQASTNANAKRKKLKSLSPKGGANTDAQSNATKTSTPQANTNANAKSKTPKRLSPRGGANTDAQSNATETSTPQASTSTNAKNDILKTPTADANSNLTQTSTAQTGANPGAQSNATNNSTPQTTASANGQSNAPKTSTPQTSASINAQNASTSSTRPNGVLPGIGNNRKYLKPPQTVQKTEIEVDMNVLARRRPMSWQQGKITEIVTKEDGRVKYKVIFEDKGKSLVRAHHIAYEYRPKLEQLFVGARVVVQPDPAKSRFCPGILGELPNRKNRMRFLVFMDDHSPVYVGLLLLNLVCKPLQDPLDDIPDGHHKDFLRKYLKAWPYPPQTQYRVGQSLNAEINGVLQRCEVEVVDSSLIHVVAADQHKEWIYRGSTCMGQMSSMKEKTKEKKEEKKQK